jgi:hydrogenase maturation protease
MSISPSESTTGATLVIGLGNPLMADDGLGLAALARLKHEWLLPEDVELVDGGTWGMNLLPLIEDARRVLFIDAIDFGSSPGATVVLDRKDLPRHFSTRLSPHQVDLKDVLAVAELRGTLPLQTAAIGLQPERVELSERLSPSVSAQLESLVQRVVHHLQGWGHDCHRCDGIPSALER